MSSVAKLYGPGIISFIMPKPMPGDWLRSGRIRAINFWWQKSKVDGIRVTILRPVIIVKSRIYSL